MTTIEHLHRLRKRVRRLGGNCPPIEAAWLCDIALAALEYVDHLERFRFPGRADARQAARVRWRELVE